MLVFPQLSTGAFAQYPMIRRLTQRSVRSSLEDGTVFALADETANSLQWRLSYRDISDQEAQSLTSFFSVTQGSLVPFVFLDPTMNLLSWSEDFTQGVWEKSGITLDISVNDPLGDIRASCAHNNSSTSLTIAQGTAIPGLAQTCFSIFMRAANPATVTLYRTAGGHSQSMDVTVTNTWQRFHLSGTFPTVTDTSWFSISIPANTSLDLFGPQVDAQATPSPYVTSVGQNVGVYSSARFDMKQFDVTATGPNRNTCVVLVHCNLSAGDNT
jgi:hypothetical protein